MPRTKHDDEKIIVRVKEGYIDEFEHIVNEYSDIIFRFVKRKLFDAEDVSDIVQESFLKFYKSISRFDEKRPVLPYLYEIAKNELKMYYRRHKKTIPLESTEAMALAFSTDPKTTDIYSALKALDPVQKEIIQSLGDGYTYAEISQKMNKNINTIKTLARRARLKLQYTHNEKNT